MSITEILVRVLGAILALVGLALVLGALGVAFLVTALSPGWLSILVGLILIAIGVHIIRGGGLSL